MLHAHDRLAHHRVYLLQQQVESSDPPHRGQGGQRRRVLVRPMGNPGKTYPFHYGRDRRGGARRGG